MRIAVIGALIIGLVGMHHLVIAACHHVGSTDATSVVTMADHGASTDMSHGHAPAPTQPADQAPAPGGAVGAAAMCLAILLLFVLVLGPRAWAHLRRQGGRPSRLMLPHVLMALARPPDLQLLSVSRT